MPTSPNGDDERRLAVLTLRCGLVADTNPQGRAVPMSGQVRSADGAGGDIPASTAA